MIDRFVFTAMTGAKSAMGQLATTSHNMANLQTPGFREMLSSFRAVPVNGGNADSRAFVVDSTPGADWTPGAVTATGNSLDAAIQDQGLFAVLRSNGQEAYTRAGKFHMDAQGFLVTSSGLSVLNEQGQTIQIPVGSQDVVIQPNGTITATLPGQKFETPVARLKLVNPAPHTLERQADGLFTSTEDLESLDEMYKTYKNVLENLSSSKAMLEVETKKGWMVVATNGNWLGIDPQDNPLTIHDVRDQLKADNLKLKKPNYYGAYFFEPFRIPSNFLITYGIYSRHGQFLRNGPIEKPLNSIGIKSKLPDYNLRMLLYNF